MPRKLDKVRRKYAQSGGANPNRGPRPGRYNVTGRVKFVRFYAFADNPDDDPVEVNPYAYVNTQNELFQQLEEYIDEILDTYTRIEAYNIQRIAGGLQPQYQVTYIIRQPQFANPDDAIWIVEDPLNALNSNSSWEGEPLYYDTQSVIDSINYLGA